MSVIINILVRDWCRMGLTRGTYLLAPGTGCAHLGHHSPHNSHIIQGQAGRNNRHNFLGSNTVDRYINATWCNLLYSGYKIIECADILSYFKVFPLFQAAGQIGLIKEGKTGSFKVTSIMNWLPQPKGLPGQPVVGSQGSSHVVMLWHWVHIQDFFMCCCEYTHAKFYYAGLWH